jgi:TRAP-type uncharacterized transport system fused permease subunit
VESLPTIKSFAHLVLPVVLLVALIAIGRSLMYSAMASTVALIVLCQIRKDTRLSVDDIIKMGIDCTKSSVIVTLPCALARLGLRFSAIIALLSAENIR